MPTNNPSWSPLKRQWDDANERKGPVLPEMKQEFFDRTKQVEGMPERKPFMAPTAPTARRYRVTVWVSVPLEEGENEDGTPDGIMYPQYTAKELQKHLIKLLRKAEPECDLEVMDYEDVEE